MTTMKRRAVFLDRDGVLNRAMIRNGKPYPPANVGEVEILPGVLDALTSLKSGGFTLVVVSNQPDVKRGTASQGVVEAINAYLAQRLPIDRFFMCYHDSDDNCDCRKPRPGMLLRASREFEINLADSFMVGDRWRDVEAGASVGCKTFFINCGYNEAQPMAPTFRVSSLLEAASIILSLGNHEKN